MGAFGEYDLDRTAEDDELDRRDGLPPAPPRLPSLFAVHGYAGSGFTPTHVTLYRDRGCGRQAAHLPIDAAPQRRDETVTLHGRMYRLVWID